MIPRSPRQFSPNTKKTRKTLDLSTEITYKAVFTAQFSRQGKHWSCEVSPDGLDWFEYDAIRNAKLLKLKRSPKLSRNTKMIIYKRQGKDQPHLDSKLAVPDGGGSDSDFEHLMLRRPSSGASSPPKKRKRKTVFRPGMIRY
eukprot:208209_1